MRILLDFESVVQMYAFLLKNYGDEINYDLDCNSSQFQGATLAKELGEAISRPILLDEKEILK